MFLKNILLGVVCFSFVKSELLYPPNDKEINHLHVMFRWDADVDSEDYIFELSNDNNFNSVILSVNTENNYYIDKEKIDWNSNYFWRVKPFQGSWINTFSFSTGSPSYEFASADVSPVEIINNNLSQDDQGIIIYGIMDPLYSAAIDLDGNEIWNSGGVDTYLFTSVDSNYSFLGDANLPPNYNGELGIEFTIEDGMVWSQPTYGDEADFLQHELIRLPNGNYMGFVITYQDHIVPNSDNYPEVPSDFDFSFEDDIPGFDFLDPYPYEWKAEKIVEWDSNGDEVWSWNPFDHYSLDDFDYVSQFWEFASQNNDPFDWTHFNALAYDEQENVVYTSSKNLSRITKIDKSTGDIIWNVGVPWLADDVIIPDNSSEKLFSGQHGLQLLDNGNLVFLDNGILSGSFDRTGISKSRAIEIKINENNSEYSAEIVWEYTMDTDLYGVISGSVQKLNNGNYFITTIGSDDGAHSLEVTSAGEIIWQVKYNVGTPQGAIYRAMKISQLNKVVGCKDLNACNYNSQVTNDDGSCQYISENECDCEGNIFDCKGVCGGSATQEECDYCLGDFDCLGICNGEAIEDCDGVCGGMSEVDECGICAGPGKNIICYDGSMVCMESDCPLSIQSTFNPRGFTLQEIYPNPFNPYVNINYHISEASKLSIEIYDINGQFIEQVLSDFHKPGFYNLVWDGSLYSSGIYLLNIRTKSNFQTKKLILLK